MLNIPFEKLRAFYSAAKFNNFSKAARKLLVTEGAVSQQIKDLEWKLGEKLFYRRGPKIELTPEGELLFTLLDPLIEQIDGIIEDFMDFTGSLQSPLKIAATQSIILNLLPPIFQEFEKKCPNVHFIVFNRPPAKIHEMVLSGGADLGVCPLVDIPEGLETKELARFPWILITPLKHPLSTHRTISIKEITSFPAIMSTRDAGHSSAFDRMLKTNHLNLKVSMKTSRWEVIKKYVEIGLGIAIVPEICLNNSDVDKLHIRSLDDLLGSLSFGLITKKKGFISSPAEEFIKMMIRFCQGKKFI